MLPLEVKSRDKQLRSSPTGWRGSTSSAESGFWNNNALFHKLHSSFKSPVTLTIHLHRQLVSQSSFQAPEALVSAPQPLWMRLCRSEVGPKM